MLLSWLLSCHERIELSFYPTIATLTLALIAKNSTQTRPTAHAKVVLTLAFTQYLPLVLVCQVSTAIDDTHLVVRYFSFYSPNCARMRHR